MIAGRRVLVTRPEPGASRTARRLAADGFEPLVLPLTVFSRRETGRIDLAGVSAIALTSANAVRAMPADLPVLAGDIPVLAVGRQTAAAAREAGFARVATGPGDGAGLAALAAQVAEGGAVLHLCGSPRDGDFETALSARGVTVRPVETYAMVATDIRDAELAALGAADAVLVYSAEGGRHLAELAARPAARQLLAGARVLCLSDKCASAVSGRLLDRVAVAARPDEDALFDLLTRGD